LPYGLERDLRAHPADLGQLRLCLPEHSLRLGDGSTRLGVVELHEHLRFGDLGSFFRVDPGNRAQHHAAEVETRQGKGASARHHPVEHRGPGDGDDVDLRSARPNPREERCDHEGQYDRGHAHRRDDATPCGSERDTWVDLGFGHFCANDLGRCGSDFTPNVRATG
jgi:hypothetical protein